MKNKNRCPAIATHKHVFGQPAFVSRENAAEAQRKALLSEQRVSAVAASERHDAVHMRQVRNNRLVRIARPVVDNRSCVKKKEATITRVLGIFKSHVGEQSVLDVGRGTPTE